MMQLSEVYNFRLLSKKVLRLEREIAHTPKEYLIWFATKIPFVERLVIHGLFLELWKSLEYAEMSASLCENNIVVDRAYANTNKTMPKKRGEN